MMNNTINNEHGFVLITSLLMLTVLMIIGIAATNTTTIELQISGNDKLAKQNFYNAEAAAMECAQRLENNNDKDTLIPVRSDYSWLFNKPASTSSVFSNVNEPFTAASDPWQVSTMDNDLQFGAIANGKVKGKSASSLNMSSSSVYGFSLYGQATKGNGRKVIEIGYRKRF